MMSGESVVGKQDAGIATLSPALNNACVAIKLADDPLFTITPYRPCILPTFFSNIATSGPSVRKGE
jgi:hypothetical protein